MKRLLGILLFSLGTVYFFGCSEVEKYLRDGNVRTVRIGFADMQLELPNNYRFYPPDDLIETVLASDTAVTLEDPRILRYEQMKAGGYDFKIYVDTMNIENDIVFLDSKHVRLTKEFVKVYAQRLDAKLVKMFEDAGVSVKRIDNQYLFGRNTQFLKLKYELTKEEFKSYATQYVISTNTKTVVVNIKSWTEEDFEELIKKARFL